MTHFVVPIPPSYTINDELNISDISSYVSFLNTNGATHVMTTAGSSQFNLMDSIEIHAFNSVVSQFPGKKILGIPGASIKRIKNFIITAQEYMDKNTHFMALYPDRYYDDKTLYDYFKEISDICADKIYIHAMFMRDGRGGQYDFKSEILNKLYEDGVVNGIKEENSNLQKSYDFVRKLPPDMDVIVAGGSMRRHQFLRSAGGNAFLSGIGNFIPQIESIYCNCIDNDISGADICLDLESKLFDTFSKYGWHQSLRIGLYEFLGYCEHDRRPWPERKNSVRSDIKLLLDSIKAEWDFYEW